MVAFLPVETVGVPGEQGAMLQNALAKEAERTGAASPAPEARVADVLATQPEGTACRESDACLAKAGRDTPSDAVLSLTLAGIGSTWLVKGRLIRSQDAIALQEVQETAEGGVLGIDRYAPDLTRRLFPDSGRKPWYRQWWAWTGVAVVAAAAGGVATWAALRDGNGGAIVIGSL
ncbi:MAG: hypothetical protein QM765_43495 [Myxococcales bacterium]